VHAAERDPAAIRHARRNLPAPGRVHRADVLAGLPAKLRSRIDVLAAVPPYVPEGEAHLIPRDLRAHEPAAALLAGPDGLAAARTLLAEAGGWLAPGGVLLLELHRDQAAAAAAIARAAGLTAGYRTGPDGQTATLRAAKPG